MKKQEKRTVPHTFGLAVEKMTAEQATKMASLYTKYPVKAFVSAEFSAGTKEWVCKTRNVMITISEGTMAMDLLNPTALMDKLYFYAKKNNIVGQENW